MQKLGEGDDGLLQLLSCDRELGHIRGAEQVPELQIDLSTLQVLHAKSYSWLARMPVQILGTHVWLMRAMAALSHNELLVRV